MSLFAKNYQELQCHLIQETVKDFLSLENIDVKTEIEAETKRIALMLRHKAYGIPLKTIPYVKKISFSRFQHFKGAFFPKWLLRFFPLKPKIEKANLDLSQILPEVKIPEGARKTKIYILARNIEEEEITMGFISATIDLDAYANTITN